jgi:uncharacterized protein with ParB-like and HNH nuclease domain
MAKEVSGDEPFLYHHYRGFVWKPEQIEALWDSILEVSIGAIMMSVDEETIAFIRWSTKKYINCFGSF